MPAEPSPRNLVQIFADNAREVPTREALSFFQNDGLSTLDWATVWSKILTTAAGLKSLGLQKGMKLAIWSANRPEWVAADAAALLLGGVSVPIYVTLAPA